ncbi:alkaline phosphatase D family protein [Candidatus Thiosymbion oneisti]|uniref:alkaline phosphatase D family protein n=1 Tax=Candidatus Thiosymbion oneisti TaxID=589554 RepID=UPI000B7E7647|nr:alkaline phosphatase D family protein [Candidatus Thiosymbion oneisti]
MKIAFTSCSKIQKYPVQKAWKYIEDENPDHLLLLGDNVYAPRKQEWDMEVLDSIYRMQLEEPNFARLIKNVDFNAIWDDHDFGANNAKGGEKNIKEELKKASLELFYKHLGNRMFSSPSPDHVYHSFEKGNIKFIMLDVRYYRTKASNESPTILGAIQEVWLTQQLDHNKKFTVVCSGSCLTKGGERLDKYGEKYDSMVKLFKDRGNVIVLSGDIHKNRFIGTHDGFFEVISSAVARNRGGLSRKSNNNYGIIEFTDDVINVNLKGRKRKDNINKSIDVNTWSVIG